MYAITVQYSTRTKTNYYIIATLTQYNGTTKRIEPVKIKYYGSVKCCLPVLVLSCRASAQFGTTAVRPFAARDCPDTPCQLLNFGQSYTRICFELLTRKQDQKLGKISCNIDSKVKMKSCLLAATIWLNSLRTCLKLIAPLHVLVQLLCIIFQTKTFINSSFRCVCHQ